MTNSWNNNTVRAGKFLAVTIGVFAVSMVMQVGVVGGLMLALSAILAFVTTYHAVAAMRCKLAAKKDFWAGFLILLVSGAIFLVSTMALWNGLMML